MQKTANVLLHYPDGSVSKEFRKEAQPDAFLFVCPQGVSYWVSLKFSLEPVSYAEAERQVALISINGVKACLPYLFPLWRLLKDSLQVNFLFAQYELAQLADGAYWAAVPVKSSEYRGVNLKNHEVHAFVADVNKTKAIALPVVPIHDREYVDKLRRSAQRETESEIKNKDKQSDNDSAMSRRFKPMRAV